VSAGSNAGPSLDGSAWVLSVLPGKALVMEQERAFLNALGKVAHQCGVPSDSCG
jgi:hypothetical protein